MANFSPPRGFTLIETLVAMSISIVVGVVISQAFYDGWKAQLNQETYSELQRDSRTSLDEMGRQIRNATSVISAVTINGQAYSSDQDTLVLRLPPLDVNNAIIVGDDYLVFEKNGDRQERLVGPFASSVRASLHTPLTLNPNVGEIIIRYYDVAGVELLPGTNNLTSARTIKISLTSSRTTPDRTFSRKLESTTILRNKTGGVWTNESQSQSQSQN